VILDVTQCEDQAPSKEAVAGDTRSDESRDGGATGAKFLSRRRSLVTRRLPPDVMGFSNPPDRADSVQL